MINGLFARYRSVEDRGSEIKGKKEKKGGRKKERMDPMGAKAENCTKFRTIRISTEYSSYRGWIRNGQDFHFPFENIIPL